MVASDGPWFFLEQLLGFQIETVKQNIVPRKDIMINFWSEGFPSALRVLMSPNRDVRIEYVLIANQSKNYQSFS